MNTLTHVDAQGQLNMVDVSNKQSSIRQATARASVLMSDNTINQILSHSNKKGDVLTTAKIAGIMAAKRCSDLIPLCHPLALSKVDVDLQVEPELNLITITSLCRLEGKTGVEMEALTAVNVAALTIFDMCKASDPNMIIQDVRVISKSGGKSGDWLHQIEQGKTA